MTNSLVQRLFDIDLWCVGAAHFVILLASFQVPYRLRWKQDLQQLMPFNRKLLWVQSAIWAGVIWESRSSLCDCRNSSSESDISVLPESS
jgi:hypothetical protein